MQYPSNKKGRKLNFYGLFLVLEYVNYSFLIICFNVTLFD